MLTGLHANTPQSEIDLRLSRIHELMQQQSMPALLITGIANIFYTTGRVINGYVLLLADRPGALWFVRRPSGLNGDNLYSIRKPEDIADIVKAEGLTLPDTIGLELTALDVASYNRLVKALSISNPLDASGIMRHARSIKTPYEHEQMRLSGIKHERVYGHIPNLYAEGMTDIELQVEIERKSRLEGCIGQFRIAGDTMELFMANILAGDNADAGTPYDFAMGGEGIDPSLPVGANGTLIRPGMSVMVDSNGNFTGYMTDMTRVFSLGTLPQLALDAHQCSIDICHAIEQTARPGVAAATLYELASSIVKERGLERHFMGYSHKAGFVGHGVGIQVNEAPVLAPRSRDILAEGQVIALEPKFVVPPTGAVGIENTYIVTSSGLECITRAPEHIIEL